MDAIVRATLVYAFMFLVFRIAGKRSLAQITTFDFVLLLIIGEATQQALLSDDFSIMNAYIIIATLVGIEILLSFLKQKSKTLDKWLEGTPVIIVDHGKTLKHIMDQEKIDETDVLQSAREKQGLERLDQIKYAILEKSGGISIVPYERN